VVDHGAFAWTDARWRGVPLAGSVLYELHVGTFTAQGTFDAAIERLDHLADLGVDAVELLPCNAFAGRWGGDTTGSPGTPSTTRTAVRRG
jgi:maltooligosyltrehalose trehalohydrolase